MFAGWLVVFDWIDLIPPANTDRTVQSMITPCGSWLCIAKILLKTHMFDILSPSNLWSRNVDPSTQFEMPLAKSLNCWTSWVKALNSASFHGSTH